MLDPNYVLTDVRYALEQLTKFRCVDRAIDALERVEAELERQAAEMDGQELDCPRGWDSVEA